MTTRALPFPFWNTSAQGVPSDEHVAGTVDGFLALLASVSPTVEPHPTTLPDTRELVTVTDLLDQVLVDCDGCQEPFHAIDLETVELNIVDSVTVCSECYQQRRFWS